uniref:Mitochondrial carrier protein n=1 Tax=Prymnesium polylepis TaxID=72548 RepID=A0A7S4JXG0_9EUKA
MRMSTMLDGQDNSQQRILGATAAVAAASGSAYYLYSNRTPSTTATEKKVDERSSITANVLSSAIGGLVHAVVEQPVVTPIEATITQMQVNGKGFATNFRQLSNLGVVNGLYRAFPAAMLGAAPKAVVHYGFLNYWINFYVSDGDIRSATKAQSAMIGVSTGASEVLFTTPLNFVKFRMQRPEWGYTGVLDAVSTIYRTEGIFAFWKGVEAVFVRNSICMLGMVYGYKEIETRIPPDMQIGRHFLAGAIGGVAGSLLSYPFEMMRAAKMHNLSFMEHMVKQGPKRLFNGWLPGACRLVITSAIMGQIMPFIKDTSKTIEKKLGVKK